MPNDATYALRQLRRSPAFTAAAIATLALGIGANAAIYAVFDTVLLRPLPVRDPARLVRVARGFTYSDFRALAGAQSVTEGMFATSDFPLHAAILRGRGQARTVNAVIASGDYFRVLGVEAAMGRVFMGADEAQPVGVISDAFWRREFSGARDAIGQTLQINKSAVTVIGVAPPRFAGEKPGNAPDVWVPMGAGAQLMASDWRNGPKSWLTVMARLRPGVSIADAQRAMGVPLEPAAQGTPDLRTRLGKPVAVAMASAGLLLLIACCNLAALVAARGSARSHEIAVRMALGAGRGRILRQLLAESLVLAAIGAVFGLILAIWLARPAAALAAAPVEWNWRVLAVTAAIAALTGVLFGIAPAVAATRPETPRATRPRIGRALIAAQVAISLALLSGAGLLGRSLWNLRHQDFGFRADGLIVADLPWEFSPAMMARYAQWRDPALERLRAIPGVRAAALSGFGPMGGAQHTGPLVAPGRKSVPSRIAHVSTGYFETTEIPLAAGRAFTAADRAGTRPVCVLTESAARELFGGGNAVGRFVSQTEQYDAQKAIEVVGVARDVRFASPAERFAPLIFVPLAQSPAPITAALARGGSAAGVRAALQAVDPEIAVASVQPLTAILDAQLGSERVLAMLAACFGGLALVLTAVGVYGVISYAVERRGREIGIRIALGARRGQVSRMVLRDLIIVGAIGVAVGGAGAVAASRAMRGLLFGIAAGDYSMAIAAAFVLAAVAAAAAWLPARRAGRVDPVTMLRQD